MHIIVDTHLLHSIMTNLNQVKKVIITTFVNDTRKSFRLVETKDDAYNIEHNVLLLYILKHL